MDKPEARAAALLAASQTIRVGRLAELLEGAEALLPWIESGKAEPALEFDAARQAELQRLLTERPVAGVVSEEKRAGLLESARERRARRAADKVAQAAARASDEDQRRIVPLGAGD